MKNSQVNTIIILLSVILLAKVLLHRKGSRSYIVRGVDDWGSGAFGASRGNRPHLGLDLVVLPGESVYAPFDMEVQRISNPYTNSPYTGIAFRSTTDTTVFNGRLWYFTPQSDIVGNNVRKGEVIGTAQDLGLKYPGITNHVHLQLASSLPDSNDAILYKSYYYNNPINYI